MKTTRLPEEHGSARLARASDRTHPPLVLVIDDSATVRKVVEVALQRAGFVVLPFPDGPSALRWLARPDAPQPALILLDIEMLGMDGYNVARMLKTLPASQQTPLIMISCRDGLLDRMKSRLVGVQWYVTKPFQVEKLVEVARLALGSGSKASPGFSTFCAMKESF